MLEVQRTCRVPFYALFSLERKKAKLFEVVEFRPSIYKFGLSVCLSGCLFVSNKRQNG